MKPARRALARLLVHGFAVAAVLGAAPVSAQTYPDRPIKYVIPFPAGGVGDVFGRIVALKLSERLGQPVIVENRPGANTIIGADLVAKAKPDGYTILQAIDSTLSMNQFLYTKLPYEPLKDFQPISMIGHVSTVLIANNSFAPNNMQELIALAKTKPGAIDYGSASFSLYLGGVLLNNMADMKLSPILYKGGTASVTGVLGGEIPISFEGLGTVIQYWKGGKIKMLGVTGSKRLALVPDLPTIAEQGVPGFDVNVWQCVVAPAGTPPEIVARLNAELQAIVKLPEVVEKLRAIGVEPVSSSPQELGSIIRSESDKWGKIIKQVGLKLQ